MARETELMRPLYWLLVFFPIALLAEITQLDNLALFFTSALAIVPLAGLLGEATESVANKTGPRLGGLLNATLGNAAELIIALVAINAGQMHLVLASLTGSILGNLLFVLGFAMLLGGLKNGRQFFDRRNVSIDATMTILAVIAMIVPSLFNHYIEPDKLRVEELSLATACVIVVLYLLFIIYTIRNCDSDSCESTAMKHSAAVPWSAKKAILMMVLSMAGIVVMSEFLVGSIEAATKYLGLTPFFVGIIVIPIIGNVAEHLVAVTAARQNKMDLSLSIALGSSLQIALFVTPILVFVSLILGNPLALEFNQLELITLMAASLIAALVSLDGESNWLEGAMLLALYSILGLAFFFLPSGL
jgi:Ca2+:H+ antiporter